MHLPKRSPRRTLAAATALFAASLVAAADPARGHAGTDDATRPFVTGMVPTPKGVDATAVFLGDWALRLTVHGDRTVSVLDDNGRPFLRIGTDGVAADHGAPAWYHSAVIPTIGRRMPLPDGVGAESPPDWRTVSRSPVWSWFDPRIRTGPGLVSPEVIARGMRMQLADFTVPVLVGDTPARIEGYIEFEPPRGNYRHTLLSSTRPAPGVTVGLLDGQAVPTFTVENRSGGTVTAHGSDGEPFLRVHDSVEANLASPTWVEISRALGRRPTTLADPAAEPRWEQIGMGTLMSWPDYRSRPPDDEPRLTGLPSDGAIAVRRWMVPLQVGSRAVELRGITEFESLPRPVRRSAATGLFALAAAAVVFGAAAAVLPNRRKRTAGP